MTLHAPPPAQPLERALKSDPCATRLHEISGAMLTYHAINGRLPADLDQLKSVQGPLDSALNFTCPATGQPYVYIPAGLRSPDDPRQIVLHDPSPDPTGQRWVILIHPPRARQAAATWVMRLPETAFQAYAPPTGIPRATTTKPSDPSDFQPRSGDKK
jgi:hypothetical protein